jgi:Fe(3+) dicitrate transport protein
MKFLRIVLSTFLFSAMLLGQDTAETGPADSDEARSEAYYEQVTVVGSPEELRELPGSAHQIKKDELQQQDQSDIHRVLRTIPGVNVQEEDGYGLRPNIGMRGTGVERSSKITLLEDGVLIAPAPYSAPAAYYFPIVGRMEMLEVRKGSSSVTQGPYTTGGVLNLVSTSIPSDFSGVVHLAGGENATGRLHAHVGGSQSRFGWMVETYQLRTDGFKELDGGGNTGFELQDYIAKFRLNSSSTARMQQSLELKLGYNTQAGDETYLGLTDSDFRRDPFRRYAASQFDLIDTEHEQYQLRHFLQLTAATDLTTTVYRNDFFRNWHKLDSVNGLSIATVLDTPDANASALALLRGTSDDTTGALRVRNNRRTYYSTGVQSVLSTTWNRHDLEFGLRFHQDEEDRFQEDERYGIAGGRMILISRDAPGSNANRVGQANVVSFFVADRIEAGRWTFTPGARVERIDLLQRDFGRSDPTRTGVSAQTRSSQLNVFVPGVGVHYSISPSLGTFFGVHKGFAPPGPGSSDDTRAEESINYELGLRQMTPRTTSSAVLFFNDYENLLGKDTASSGGAGSGDLFNGGAVEVSGVELSFASDLSTRAGIGFPVRFAYTWTEAEFQTSFDTTFEDWAPHINAGDEIPYLPRNQAGASIGLTRAGWGAFLSASYADRMRTKAGQGSIRPEQSTDEYVLLDFSADYAIYRGVKLFAQVRNLTDLTYVAARRPAGLRPGLPRSVLLGAEWSF